MKKFLKIWLVLLLALSTSVQVIQAEEFSVSAEHAVAVEVASGKILYEQNAETPVAIGSITTLLTAYLVYEAIEEGKLSMDSVVTIGDYSYSLIGTVVSNVAMASRTYTVQELLSATLITSANTSAIALAEKIAGSEPAFVDRMKAKLTEWGISDAKLVNATGLNNAYLDDQRYPGSDENDENQLSAMDVAIVARRLLLDFPQVLDITSQYYFNFYGNSYSSTNQMLKEGTYGRPGVDGLKTGTSETAGASFVATVQQRKMRVLTVVLLAKEGKEYPDNRFSATNELLDYVYNNFTQVSIVKKGEQYQSSSVDVFNGKISTSKAVAKNSLSAIIRHGASATVSAKYTDNPAVLDAPIQKEQALGTLTLVDKDLIGRGYLDQEPSVEMVAAKTIPAAKWPVSWWNHFVRYVNENL